MHYEFQKLLNFNFGSNSNGANTQSSRYTEEQLFEPNLFIFWRFDATDFMSMLSIVIYLHVVHITYIIREVIYIFYRTICKYMFINSYQIRISNIH